MAPNAAQSMGCFVALNIDNIAISAQKDGKRRSNGQVFAVFWTEGH
jgi:hypothetical protein